MRKFTNFNWLKSKLVKIENCDNFFRIAREREEFWREKQENKNKLHATYQYQMATREPQLPRAYSDGKVFGKHDLNKEKLAKIKERNRTYATENSNIHHV